MPEREGDLMDLHSYIVLDRETLVEKPETSHKAAPGANGRPGERHPVE